MYATVRRASFRPDSVEEVVRRVQESFVPAMTGSQSFVDFYMVNLGNGVISTISVFETEVAAEEANKFFSEWARRDLVSFLQGPPDLAIGEVVIHATK